MFHQSHSSDFYDHVLLYKPILTKAPLYLRIFTKKISVFAEQILISFKQITANVCTHAHTQPSFHPTIGYWGEMGYSQRHVLCQWHTPCSALSLQWPLKARYSFRGWINSAQLHRYKVFLQVLISRPCMSGECLNHYTNQGHILCNVYFEAATWFWHFVHVICLCMSVSLG